MRTPAETRAFYPDGPGATYSMYFCDGVKILDELETVTFTADSDDDATAHARTLMRDRPAHEIGELSRPVKRGHSVHVAAISERGARVEADDMHVVWRMHDELHRCGKGGVR